MAHSLGFMKGINYWPARTAMYWWKHFNASEVQQDFQQLSRLNFEVVRIFLVWEDFQPVPDNIPRTALDNLKATADIAMSNQLMLMPTFFCGHMSGVNWMPAWMLEETIAGRFPVYSCESVKFNGIRNFYTEAEIMAAQKWQLEKIGQALQDHPAVWAFDLGNESSNCVIPPNREAARHWLEVMTAQLKKYSGNKPVTLGMHAEDLEEDRHLWPQDAALYCDFLCMHGYPFYLSWTYANDVNILPFLALVTNWLGDKAVLFQEFGLPTLPIIPPPFPTKADWKCALWTETEGLAYYRAALDKLTNVAIGAMGWCYADYSPLLWNKPPLDLNPHERHFGLFRHDGTPKQAVQAFLEHHTRTIPTSQYLNGEASLFASINRNDFYTDPLNNLRRLYQQYQQTIL